MRSVPPPASDRPLAPWRELRGLALAVLAAWGLMAGLRWWQSESDARALRAALRPGELLMMASRDCLYCAQARQWLQAQRLPFRECQIETDADCALAYQAQGARGTPTFVLRGQRVLGWDRAGLRRVLDQPLAP